MPARTAVNLPLGVFSYDVCELFAVASDLITLPEMLQSHKTRGLMNGTI